MGGDGEEAFDVVLVASGHAGNTASAAALCLISIHGLAFDITEVGKGDNSVFHGNKVFHIHFAADGFDSGAAVVAVFIGNFAHFGFDDRINKVDIAENVFEFCNFCADLGKFVFHCFAVEGRKTAQAHLENCV